MDVGKSTFTFSTSSITIDGGSTTINITRDNWSYSHKLLHGYGDIATLAVGTTSYTWKPTAAQLTKFFEEVPNQKSRTIDVYLDTYNGSTKVGRDVHSLTVTLSEATGKPTISGYTIKQGTSAVADSTILAYGKISNLVATTTCAAKYGATITGSLWHPDGSSIKPETFSSFEDAFAYVANSMEAGADPIIVQMAARVQDSRGFVSGTFGKSLTVAKYKAPHIDTFEVIRCDTSGKESDNGTKAKIALNGGWAAFKVGSAYKNPATLKVGYRTESSSGAYTYQSISVTGGSFKISQLLSATFTANTDYEFSAVLTDSYGEADSLTEIGFSNVGNILYVSPDGKEMVIGSDTGNNVAIDSDSVDIREGSTVNASFTKNKIELGKNNQHAIISMMNDSLKMQTSQVDAFKLSSLLATDGLWLTAFRNDNDTDGTIKIYKESGAGNTYTNMDLSVVQIHDQTLSKTASIKLSTRISGDGSTYSGESNINLEADSVHVSGGFTEDIPVLTSGDCDTLTKTGKYYIGNSGTHRPVNTNGWLDSRLYSDDHCFQTYITHTGYIYRRLMEGGTWSNWFSSVRPKKLWDGSLSKGGSVTIPELAKYTIIGIGYGASGLGYFMFGQGPTFGSSYLTTSTQVDNGSSSYVLKATFRYYSSTGVLTLTSASHHLLNSSMIGFSGTVHTVYGIC